MIEKIIEKSVANKFIILLLFIVIVGWGIWALLHTPLDAIPDLSDNQVIVFTEWPGRSPQTIEDQITYPLAANLQGLPGIRVVRAESAFGYSMIYVIFEDKIDLYWARTRVLERLSYAQGLLPMGVRPTLGPDGTGVGHVFWYTVEGETYDLGELRAIQDWYIRYQLNSVPGVVEVASIGGFVKQYQIDLDPNKLLAYKIPVSQVKMAVERSNNDVGGKLIEASDMEYVVRGLGYLKSTGDIENIVVGADKNGVPIYVRNLGIVQLGSDIRRGLLDKNGDGEVVGGIVVMRYLENAKDVIDRVKAKIKELEKGLPPGVEIKTAYDRAELIEKSIATLKENLIEICVIVSVVILIFLFHFKASLAAIISIPVAVLIGFITMYYLKITSNIMSLGGIAIAIGVLVDATIIMVENAYRHLSESKEKLKDITPVVLKACQQVGRPIFFSLLILIISFLPVFLLQGQEGKLFRPLAFTKTSVMAGAAIIAITLIPVLITLLLKGKLRPEEKNPISRFFIKIYEPVIKLTLKYKVRTLIISGLILIATIFLTGRIGKEFMPPLDEGSLLFMPITLPNITITEAKRILQVQDKIIQSFPEVEQVLGKVGRAETATDPAPVSMIETIVLLKPKAQWRKGMTREKVIEQLDNLLRIPGVRNAWTMPIINRINMLTTGVRTDIGVKILGSDLKVLNDLSLQSEKILKDVPGATGVVAERVVGGKYIDIAIQRDQVARYGINVGEVQDIIETAVGGMNLTNTVEGRQRFPIRIRYLREYRDNLETLKRVLVPTPSGAQIPLEQLTDIKITPGPPSIFSENSLLRSVVFLNVVGRDIGGFVDEAKAKLEKELKLPSGYYVTWSGQYENQIRAKKRLQLLVPMVIFIIFILLYFTFKDFWESLIIMLSVPFALVGGVLLQYILGYNFSVAVWVGFIALFGIAVETGVVMVVYLHEALDRKLRAGPVGKKELSEAILEGAVLRLRPKLMTVGTTLIGLIPIMWSTGTGSDVMKPITAPMIGGVITSAIHVLIVTPAIFGIMKERALKRGTLKISGITLH